MQPDQGRLYYRYVEGWLEIMDMARLFEEPPILLW